MSENRVDDGAQSATQSEANQEEAQGLSGPGAGLGATGKTADQFTPGDEAPGTTYGDPGGAGSAGEEVATEGMSNAVETEAKAADQQRR